MQFEDKQTKSCPDDVDVVCLSLEWFNMKTESGQILESCLRESVSPFASLHLENQSIE